MEGLFYAYNNSYCKQDMCFVVNVLTGAEWHVNTDGRRDMNYELCIIMAKGS